MLDLDTATPFAELISNSYLHAFPACTGPITVSLLWSEASQHAVISFVDDGVGFTATNGSKRHGLGLVKRLMEPIDGSAEVRITAPRGS